ncbi:hypothetical protein [Rufibacter immobilis]|uniref:hypothetical protein n=1 Tax=Rufibacter immobilis TaxID=1348778 RepID=UPI0035EFFD48
MRPLLFLLLAGLSLASCQDAAQKPETAASPETGNAQDTSAVANSSPVDTAFQITPGQRVGQVNLGDSPEKVHAALGDPEESDAAMGKSISTWYSKGTGKERHRVDVYTVRENTGTAEEVVQVKQVRVTSPNFMVAEKQVRVGSTLAEIRNGFPAVQAVASYKPGNAPQIYLYDAPAEGISFEISGPDSTCVGIAIHPKDQNIASTYLPIYPNLQRLTPQ